VSAALRTLRAQLRSRKVTLLAGIVLTTAIACRDVLSPRQPGATAAKPTPPAEPRQDESPNNSPDLQSFDLAMTDPTDGTMGTSSPNVAYPFATVLRITVKGLENRLPLFSQIGDPITRGPSGHAVFGWNDLGVYNQVVMGPSTDVLAESVVVYRQIKGTLVTLGRSGYGTRRYDGTWFNGVQIWCGQDHDHPCDNWTGTTNFKFVRLNAGLTLTVDSTIANSGSRVTFKLRSVPDTVEGQQIPVIVDTASWVPDPDSVGGDYTELQKSGACNFSGYPKTCQRTLDGPGTLNVVAYSNGKRFALSQHIATRDARPIVVPSKYYARHAGDTVNFTVHMSDGSNFTMWNWIWFADTTPSQTHTTCASYANPCLNTRVFERGHIQATVSHNGRLKKNAAYIKVGPPPRLQLAANPTTVTYDVPVAFTTSAGDAPYAISSWTYRLGNGSTGATSCAAPNKTCTSTVPGGGTMTVMGTVDGSPDSASVSLTWLDKYELKARPSLIAAGQVVTFRPYLNGQPAPAVHWRWVQQGGPATEWDSVTGCVNGAMECHRVTFESGTMWAYRATSGGDSASAAVNVSSECVKPVRTRRPGSVTLSSRTGGTRPRVTARTLFGLSKSLQSMSAESCTDTARTGGDGGTDSLQMVALTIATDIGATMSPTSADSVYPIGTIVPYVVVPRAGYGETIAAVDDSITGDWQPQTTGVIAMNQAHKLDGGARIAVVNSGLAAVYAGKLDSLVRRSNDKPEAYRRFLQWSTAEAGIQGRHKFDSLMAAARVIAFDPMTNDSAAMATFDRSVGGYWFEWIGDSVVKHPPGFYADSFPIITAAQRRRPNPGRLSEEIATPPKPLVIFINGIFTLENAVTDVSDTLRLIVDEHYGGRVLTTHWYNPTFKRQWEIWDQSHKCAYSWTRRLTSITDTDGSVTGFSMMADWVRCKGGRRVEWLRQQDLVECATQVFNLLMGGVQYFPDPEFVGKMAYDSKGSHDRGQPTIYVAHSQGTLMVANALNRPELDTSITQSAKVCTAGLGLAPAVSNYYFQTNHPNVHWGSFRVKHDILSLITIDGIPIQYDVDSVGGSWSNFIDDWALAHPVQWSLKPVKAYWGLQVHYLNPAYLKDNRELLKNRLFGIVDFCVPPT